MVIIYLTQSIAQVYYSSEHNMERLYCIHLG